MLQDAGFEALAVRNYNSSAANSEKDSVLQLYNLLLFRGLKYAAINNYWTGHDLSLLSFVLFN